MSQACQPMSVMDAVEALLPKLAGQPRYLRQVIELMRENRKAMRDGTKAAHAAGIEHRAQAMPKDTARPLTAPIVEKVVGLGAVPGSHQNGWRVLPIDERNRMMRQLYELGWTLDKIAAFTRENAHRTTVSRAITSKT